MKVSLIRFDEMSFIRFDEMLLIKFNEIQLIRFDEMLFVKFDELLSSSLMSRFRRAWWVASSSFCHFEKIELDFVRHLEKIRIEQSKHKRWDD
jgi:hypothetical protein